MKTGGTTNIFPYLAYDDYVGGTLNPTDGKFGGAIYYDLNSNTFSEFVLGTDIKSAGSVSMFVKHSTDTYRKQYLSSEFGNFEIATSGSSVNYSVYASLPGNSLDDIGNVKPTTGVWHHLVVTWDETAGDFLLYVDGVLQPGSVSGGTVTGPDFTSSVIRVSQRHTTDGAISRNFDGGIDDLAFYNSVLTPTQISNIGANGAENEQTGQVALWKFDNAAGVAPIPSNFSASSTINMMNSGSTELRPYLSFNQYEGARFNPTGGKFNGALFFDTPYGATTLGEIESADFDIKSAGSLSFFVKHDYTGYRQQYISSHGAGFEVAMHSTGRIYASTNIDTYTSGGTIINDNNWHHVVVTWDESTTELSCYLDGNLQLNKTGAVGPDFYQNSIRVGQRQDNALTRNLDGGIDDIAFYNKVLSASEIAQIAAAGAFSVPNGLVAGFRLDDPVGTTSVIAEPIPLPAPITSIGNPTPSACGTLDVPVAVQDFTGVANISLILNYNPAVLEYQSVDINAALSGAFSNGAAGTFILGRNSGTNEINLGENEVLFTLHFNILPSVVGESTTDLTWDLSDPENCEYSSGGTNPEVYSSTFNDLTVTIPARPIKNTTAVKEYCTIQAAIDDATAGDNILVNTTLHIEGPQIIVNKDINLSGLGKAATTLNTSGNTASSGDLRGWFLVNDGVEFNLSDITLDGAGYNVYQGIRHKGFGTIDEVNFTNIKHPGYAGVAVAAFGSGTANVDITNSDFSEIGRVGVLYFGTGITGSDFHDNTYLGKGPGNWIDYMLDISAGAVVDVQGCTVSGNRGVASTDGSTSAGILVTTFFAAGTTANISGCDITDNTTGIAVGYDASDGSVVTAEDNKIYGNEYGVASTGPLVDASPNWWGFASGPYNDPYNVCGEGNEVSANVTFRQWWTDEAMAVLSSSSNPVIDVTADITGMVECFDAATEPALPVVKDFCGTVLTPDEPEITNIISGCEGTKTYEYIYTDVLGGSLVWTYTYTIDRTTAPVVPANSSKTVACPADAVNPALLSTVADQQQLQTYSGGNWTNFTSIGQSFTCGTSGWLTKLDLRVGSIAAVQNFTLQIYQGNGIAGTLLYTGSHSLTAVGWQSLNIVQELAPYLTAGVKYTFWLTSFSYNQLGLLCMNPNVYNGGVSMDGCTSGCSPTYAWQQWPAYDLVFKTYMTAIPIVKDVCGTVIPTPTPVVTETPVCEGTKEYTYTYTDCAGNSTPWVFTYNIERNPFTIPANTTATVACVADVVVPTPPAVNDNCGNPITPVAGTTPTAPVCEGTMVYQWTYTDCEGNNKIWKHTVTIDDNIAPTITTYPTAVTVNMNTGCTATGVDLGMPTATDNCGGTVTFTNDAPTEFPDGETIVTWTAEDCAGNTATCTQTVMVVRNTISGTLAYNNTAKTAMNLVKLVLKDATDTQVGDIVTTDGSGGFTFPNLCAGTYTIEVTENKKDVGGINSTDAGAVNFWSSTHGSDPIEHVKFLAGDVTNAETGVNEKPDKFISSDDALKIQRKFVFHEDFADATPDWVYWKADEIINHNEDPYATEADWPTAITVIVNDDIPDLELYGMATGDFNGSLVPTLLKSAHSSLTLEQSGSLQIGANQEFELPLRAERSMDVSAVSMILQVPSNLAKIRDVVISGSKVPVMWAVNGDELRIGWNSLTPVHVAENGSLIVLKLSTSETFTMGQSLDISLPFDPLNELADGNLEAMDNAYLLVARVGTGTVGVFDIDNNAGMTFRNYPNPFRLITTLEYKLPVAGNVSLNVYNSLGQLVSVVVDQNQQAGLYTIRYNNTLQPGIYLAKLRLSNSDVEMVNTLKMSVTK